MADSLMKPSRSSGFVRQIASMIEERAPNLVSFSESMIDQSAWERPADPRVVGSSLDRPASLVVEVGLFSLIENFTGHIAMSALAGTEFLEVYPSALDDMWSFDAGSTYLSLGLPRWLGIPSLTRAHIARRKLLMNVKSFQQALDSVTAGAEPEQPWRELADVSDLLLERNAVWRKHGTSLAVRAPSDLSLLWAYVKPDKVVGTH